MKIFKLIVVLGMTIVITSCNSKDKKEKETKTVITTQIKTKKDSVAYSFVFMGCNRVDRHQQFDTTATNGSTANLVALKKIWNDVTTLERKPDAFFFLGDMVLAESTLDNLNNQLRNWVKLYKDPKFSSIDKSGIEMIAVPGNHEMLYYHDYNVPNHDEWPLKGATALWMKYMHSFMPKDRLHITGKDSIVNQMTFAFQRKNIGFVVMNTDTYNAPTKEYPYGIEGQIPTDWIIRQVETYRKNPKIDHIFVLGHKPYYVSGKPETGHIGLPEGPVLWPALQKNKVSAMLSAHLHDYQRMQPDDKGTYQIIAGNAGSPGTATFFGYSKIDIMKSGKIKFSSIGYDKGNPYYISSPDMKMTLRDSTTLTWEKNKNQYQQAK